MMAEAWLLLDAAGGISAMSDSLQPTPLDLAFQAWLEQVRNGKRPETQGYLADQPEALRSALAEMIADFESLQMATDAQAPAFSPGRVLGDFELVRELGHGGMGSVWEAEQLSLKRRVALKLLKPQFSFSPILLQRFQREAEAGGRLQHVGIVQTYGVGETEGVHWIAQELVSGGLTLADALASQRCQTELPGDWYPRITEWFARIAEAVEAAHQAGVVHRDLKPGNILLGDDGKPKVADFGLAQIQDDLALSRTGEFLGTPFYMSPEQALSRRMGLDHRSDVFSLGATLYESLTLVRAFDGDTSQQVFHKIITEEPPDPRKLRSRVPRDLAVICGKCLEKSPDRRYSSMGELAADLRRVLDDQAIHAQPPGVLVRTAKWCRRHPVFATGTAVAVVALVAISGLAWRLSDEQDHTAAALEDARQQAGTAQRVIEFLIGMFEVSDPGEGRGNTVTARELLDQGAADIQEELRDEPVIQAKLLDVMGSVYQSLGLLDQAEPLFLNAESLRRQHLGADHTDTVVSLNNLAGLYYAQGFTAKAEPIYLQALEASRRINGPDHDHTLTTLNNLGVLYSAQEELSKAEEMLAYALESSRRVKGSEDPDTLAVISNYGLLLLQQGKLEQAEPLVREELEASRRVNGNEDPDTLISINNLGLLLFDLGKLDQAEPLLREALAGSQRILGPEHQDTLTSINNLGLLLQQQGKLTEAEALLRQALAGSRRVLKDDHPSTLISLNNLGRLLQRMKRLDEAEPLHQEALATCRRTLAPDHPGTLSSLFHMARLRQAQGRLDAAQLLAEELLRLTPEDSVDRPDHLALLEAIQAQHKE